MATFTISSDTNYSSINGGSFADYDRITITEGATVTINTDTNIIERMLCITLGKMLIQNTSTTTPIIVKTGSDDSANAQISFEAGGEIEIDGAWIELGVSTGLAGQMFALPTTASLETLPLIPTIFVFDSGATDPVIYNRVSTLTDSFGDDKFGTVFTHNTTTNMVTFGDGTEGYIPPAGASIRIPNIFFSEESNASQYTDWDITTSGTVVMDKCLWGDNYAFNFGGGLSATISNTGFGFAREDMTYSATTTVDVSHCGILMQNNSHLFNLSAVNDPVVDNVFIYQLESGSNYHGFFPVNAAGGTFTNCRVVAPDHPTSTTHSGMYLTNANVTISNYYYAGAGVGINIGAGGSNATITDCGINAAGKRNPTRRGAIALVSANSAGCVIRRYSSYPDTAADGLVSHDTYFISLSTGTADYTVDDCDIYAGLVGDASRTNSPFFSNGANHRINDIRVTGDHSGDVIDHSTASIGTEMRNVKAQNSMANTNDFEWVDKCVYDYVYTADVMDTAPTTNGLDVGTMSFIQENTTAGWLYKPMGAHPTSGLLEEGTMTGSYFFNNAGALYMDTAGDQLIFTGNVHGAITDFTGWTRIGTNSANFAIEFAMRNPGGTWTAWQSISVSNLSTTLSGLSGYDSDVGLQMRFRVTRSASNLTDFLNSIRLTTTLDPNYVSPFEVFPTKATFKGITVGDVVYVQDASDNIKLFTTATTTDDIELKLPNANAGETWTYVIKRAGYVHQKGTITIAEGSDVTVNVSLTQKQQATGGAMYTGSNSVSVTTDFDFVTPQFSIDISAADTSAQNVFDATENALITQDGMKWLAKEGTDTSFVNLGGAGSFLFHQDDIRVRRTAPANENAGISAYVFSTQAQPVDEANGTINLFSGTIVNDFLEADFDDGDGEYVTVGQMLSRLNSMLEQDGSNYRYTSDALAQASSGLTLAQFLALK